MGKMLWVFMGNTATFWALLHCSAEGEKLPKKVLEEGRREEDQLQW